MTRIYKLVVGKGQSTRWYSLPQADRDAFWAKIDPKFAEVGGQRRLMVDSSWASEEYPRFFIEEYPSVEAVMKFTAYLNEINFLQYFNVRTIIGAATEPETTFTKSSEVDKTKVYKLVIAKGQPYRWLALPEAQRNAIWDKAQKAFEDAGGQRIYWADSSWSSEEYPGFFVEVFPNIEALHKYTAVLNQLYLFDYFDVITVVGTEIPMK